MIDRLSPEQLGRRREILDALLEAPFSQHERLATELFSGEDELLQAVLARDLVSLRHVRGTLAALDRRLDVARPAPPDHEILSRLGPYRLVSVLGQGGMGTVFEAIEDPPLERRVALKVLDGESATPAALERFQGECDALARMDHDGIARVYRAGTDDSGHPYIAMEFIAGRTLAEHGATFHPDPYDCVDLFIPICEAIEHAHERGILHRDIKPSNIIVADAGAGPRPKIIDFGVAKGLYEKLHDATLTRSGFGRVGTVAYMSPERLRGEGERDVRSDIYSIGVCLYESLTRERAFAGGSPEELAREVATHSPVPPRRIAPHIPFDLETVVLKAMAHDPAERYPTALDLAADLRRVREGRAIRARRAGPRVLVARWLRRHRSLATGILATLAVATIAGIAILASFHHTLDRRATELLAQTRELERVRYFDSTRLASIALRDGDLDRGRQLLAEQRRSESFPALARFEHGYLRRALHPELASITMPGASIEHVRPLPDPDRVLLVGSRRPDVDENILGIWNLALRRFEEPFPSSIPLDVSGTSITPDGGTLLIAAFTDADIRHYDIGRRAIVRTTHTWSSRPATAQVSPDGLRLGFYRRELLAVHDLREGRDSLRLRVPDEVRQTLFDWKTDTIHVGGEQNVFAYRVPGLRQATPPEDAESLVLPDLSVPVPSPIVGIGRTIGLLVTAHENGDLVARNAETLEPLATTKIPDSAPSFSMAVSPDEATIVVGDELGFITRFDAKTLVEMDRFRAHAHRIDQIAFLAGGRHYVTASSDRTARLFSRAAPRRAVVDATTDSPFWGVRIRDDGQVVTERGDLRIDSWDAPSARVGSPLVGDECGRFETWERPSRSWLATKVSEMFCLGPRGRIGAASTAEYAVALGLLGPEGEPTRLPSFEAPIYGMGFSEDGEWFAASSLSFPDSRRPSAQVRVWKRTTRDLWTQAAELRCTATSHTLLLDPDRSLLVIGGRHDSPVEVWNWRSGRRIATVAAQSFVAELALRPGGRHVLTAGEDGSIQFWSLEGLDDGREVTLRLDETLFAHRGRVSSLAFFPGGDDLVTSVRHGPIKLWRLRDAPELEAIELLSLEVPDGETKQIAVAQNRAALAAVGVTPDGDSGWLRVWFADELAEW